MQEPVFTGVVSILQYYASISMGLLIRRSAARMAGLIDNVLDFPRSRMGEGFFLNLSAHRGLAAEM